MDINELNVNCNKTYFSSEKKNNSETENEVLSDIFNYQLSRQVEGNQQSLFDFSTLKISQQSKDVFCKISHSTSFLWGVGIFENILHHLSLNIEDFYLALASRVEEGRDLSKQGYLLCYEIYIYIYLYKALPNLQVEDVDNIALCPSFFPNMKVRINEFIDLIKKLEKSKFGFDGNKLNNKKNLQEIEGKILSKYRQPLARVNEIARLLQEVFDLEMTTINQVSEHIASDCLDGKIELINKENFISYKRFLLKILAVAFKGGYNFSLSCSNESYSKHLTAFDLVFDKKFLSLMEFVEYFNFLNKISGDLENEIQRPNKDFFESVSVENPLTHAMWLSKYKAGKSSEKSQQEFSSMLLHETMRSLFLSDNYYSFFCSIGIYAQAKYPVQAVKKSQVTLAIRCSQFILFREDKRLDSIPFVLSQFLEQVKLPKEIQEEFKNYFSAVLLVLKSYGQVLDEDTIEKIGNFVYKNSKMPCGLWLSIVKEFRELNYNKFKELSSAFNKSIVEKLKMSLDENKTSLEMLFLLKKLIPILRYDLSAVLCPCFEIVSCFNELLSLENKKTKENFVEIDWEDTTIQWLLNFSFENLIQQEQKRLKNEELSRKKESLNQDNLNQESFLNEKTTIEELPGTQICHVKLQKKKKNSDLVEHLEKNRLIKANRMQEWLLDKGWVVDRIKGSHFIFKLEEETLPVPIKGKGGGDLAKGTMNAIVKQVQKKEENIKKKRNNKK